MSRHNSCVARGIDVKMFVSYLVSLFNFLTYVPQSCLLTYCGVPVNYAICDMIKRNESDVGDVVFEILAKTGFKFLCFILFLALSNLA